MSLMRRLGVQKLTASIAITISPNSSLSRKPRGRKNGSETSPQHEDHQGESPMKQIPYQDKTRDQSHIKETYGVPMISHQSRRSQASTHIVAIVQSTTLSQSYTALARVLGVIVTWIDEVFKPERANGAKYHPFSTFCDRTDMEGLARLE